MSRRAPKPLHVDDLAAHIGIDRRTVIRAIARGEIRAERVGRQFLIPRSELDRLSGVEAAA